MAARIRAESDVGQGHGIHRLGAVRHGALAGGRVGAERVRAARRRCAPRPTSRRRCAGCRNAVPPTGQPTAPTMRTAVMSGSAPDGARILVADDNADMRAYIRRLLGAPAKSKRCPMAGRRWQAMRARKPGSGADRRDDAAAGRLRVAARNARRSGSCATCRSSCCRRAPARRRGSRAWMRARTII